MITDRYLPLTCRLVHYFWSSLPGIRRDPSGGYYPKYPLCLGDSAPVCHLCRPCVLCCQLARAPIFSPKISFLQDTCHFLTCHGIDHSWADSFFHSHSLHCLRSPLQALSTPTRIDWRRLHGSTLSLAERGQPGSMSASAASPSVTPSGSAASFLGTGISFLKLWLRVSCRCPAQRMYSR